MTAHPGPAIELFLHPGEWEFVDAQFCLRTTLGSCIAFTLWHPVRFLGGMCHFMLPERGCKNHGYAPDGRYADEAIELLLEAMRQHGTQPSEYEVKVIGGGNLLPPARDVYLSVAERNIEAARRIAAIHNLCVRAEHVGGRGYRNVHFDVLRGDVWVRYVSVEER